MISTILHRQSRSDFLSGPSFKEKPLSFDFELTARCNNNCRHCYINTAQGDIQSKKKELSLKEIKHIAEQAVEMGTLWCLISGGEPLLRDDFEEIYMLLKRNGLLVSLYTNGTLIQQRHVDLFKKYPPRLIEITVYGISQNIYGRVTRRPDLFPAFQRGLDLLVENDIPVRLKSMALRSNLPELPGIADFCRKYTKDYYRFDPLLHLRYDRNAKRNREIVSERLSGEEIAELEHNDNERSEALVKGCDILIYKEKKAPDCGHLFHCGAGLGSFSLSWDGFFRLCSSLCAPTCSYNLRNGDLKEAWNVFRPQVRAMKTQNRAFCDTCGQCTIFNLCPWCVANSFLESGKFDEATEYFCEVAHARARKLMEKMHHNSCKKA